MKKRVFIFFTLLLSITLSFSSSLKLKFGVFSPQCNSDIWEINFENLILQKSDFKAPITSFEYEQMITKNISFSFEAGKIEREEVATEYRDYEYEDGTPIAQGIYYKINMYEIGARFYPLPRRSRLYPYFGVSAGLYHYIYNQYGEFIDFEEGVVFDGDFLADQYAFGLSLNAGLSFNISRFVFIGVEGKYLTLKGDLGSEFEGFEPIDLSGVSTLFVLGIRF